MDRARAWIGWLLPVLVFLGIRLVVLATSIDRLGHLGEGELAHADLAVDLAEGLELRPLWQYQVVPFHGGTLVSSLLFVPWSRLFGVSFAALKGLALGYALVAMVAWMWLLHRWAGRGPALLFAWLYAVAPPVLIRMQLTLWGTHAELSAVLGVCLVMAQRWLEAPDPARARRLFWTGVAAGFALYFNYASSVFLALLLPGVLLERGRSPDLPAAGAAGPEGGGAEAGVRAVESPPPGLSGHPSPQAGEVIRRALRRAPLLSAGLLLGLSPLALSLWFGQARLEVYGQGPAGLLEGGLERLLQLPSWIMRVPALSPQMPPPPAAQLEPFGALIHLALFLAAAALVVRARALPPDRRLLPALTGAYPFLFLGVFTAVHLPFTTSTSGTFGYCPRYAATLYPFLYAALALFAAGPAARIRRPLALLAAAALIIPAAREIPKLIDGSSPEMARRFDAVRFVRAGLWGADRVSLPGIEAFLARDRAGEVPGEVARGVRAVLGEAWDTDYWRFLRQPPDGPAREAVEARVRSALEAPGDEQYRAGVAWGRAIALGLPVDP